MFPAPLRGPSRAFFYRYVATLGLSLFASVARAASILSIMGTPTPTLEAGQYYYFQPSVVVLGIGAYRFAIENPPPWATFDPTTGRLSGFPASSDMGTYRNVKISAYTGLGEVLLKPFTIWVTAPGPQHAIASGTRVTVTWVPPQSNSDGSPMSDLAGYQIYLGTTPDNLRPYYEVGDPVARAATLRNLKPGLNYFAVSAYNSAGLESRPSAAVGAVVE